MEKLKENKKIVIPLILVALIFILGAAYAWLTTVLNGTQINRIKAGTLELVLDDTTSDGIDIEYAIPQSNEQGLSNSAYTFTVRNTGTMNAEYKLFLEDEEIEGTRISDSNIKYNLVKNNGEDNPKLLSTTIEDNKRVLESTIIDGNSTNTYSLKLWIDSEATQSEVANKVFKAKIKLEAVQSENSSSDKYDVEGTITKDGEVVTSGVVVIYPSGETSSVSGEGEFNISNLDYGDHNVYYVPNTSENDVKNMTEDQIKTKSGVIPTKIIVNPGNRTITPGQGYEMTINITKKTGTYTYTNSHIKAAYTYSEGEGNSLENYTGCLGGEEAGCVQRNLISTDTVPTGTIVKYEVAPGVEKYFNVLYDNGETLTMQQRENTIYNTAWYAGSNDNTQGPTTVLPALEAATSDWEYVNNQTYTAGVTSFGTGEFATANTACTWTVGAIPNASLCSGKTYADFTKTNVKARMITANEAGDMDCKIYKSDGSSNMSCKKFMNNYLFQSPTYGGTLDDYHTGSNLNYGYWTMSADLSTSMTALCVLRSGYVNDRTGSSDPSFGARAVVVINK